jgi:isopentenyldiphosphate isomerase/esterase/lipase
MQEEMFEAVNEYDNVIGTAPRKECHSNPSMIHRGIYVMVFDRRGRLLLQKRSMKKDLGKGMWDISTGGHNIPGETYAEAAKRELKEELGISVLIRRLGKLLMRKEKETEYNAIFTAVIDEKTAKRIKFEKDEIDEIRFFTIDEIHGLPKSKVTYMFWDVMNIYFASLGNVIERHASFFNSKKEKISAILFTPSEKGKFPAFVFCHGFTSSKHNKKSIARNIARKGFAVLIFDASGSGESGGRFEDHSISKYVSEVGSAIQFMKKQDFVDPGRICIGGHSLGGMVSLAYAAKASDLKLVISIDAPYHLIRDRGPESSFVDKDRIKKWEKSGFAMFDVRIRESRVPKKLSYKFVRDAEKYDLSKMVGRIKCPVVIVQGDADTTVPPWHACLLFVNSPEPKELIFVSGVNHQYHGKNEKTLEDILVENLLKYT